MKITMLKSVVTTWGRLNKGQTMDLAESYAKNLLEGGYAQMYVEPAKQEEPEPVESEQVEPESNPEQEVKDDTTAQRRNTRGSKKASKD